MEERARRPQEKIWVLQIERGEERERKPWGRDKITTATEQQRSSNGLSLSLESLSLSRLSLSHRVYLILLLAQRAMGVHVVPELR